MFAVRPSHRFTFCPGADPSGAKAVPNFGGNAASYFSGSSAVDSGGNAPTGGRGAMTDKEGRERKFKFAKVNITEQFIIFQNPGVGTHLLLHLNHDPLLFRKKVMNATQKVNQELIKLVGIKLRHSIKGPFFFS